MTEKEFFDKLKLSKEKAIEVSKLHEKEITISKDNKDASESSLELKKIKITQLTNVYENSIDSK